MSRSTRWFPFVMALAGLCAAPGIGHAATFVVTSTGDASDANTADNVCAISGGGCTLRAAIQQANATAGADAIHFSIGTGLQTISPGSPLPAITEQLTLDGATQPGAAPPAITIDGLGAGLPADGLVLSANGCALSGLVVRRFTNHGIVVNSSNNTLARNHIGTNAAGTADFGNAMYGIAITGNNNTIGGPAASYADRNVISGNDSAGVFVSGSGNLLQSNFIGTNRQGTAEVHNGNGVVFENATGNTIRSSIISGNTGIGVRITFGGTNTIRDNTVIGLNNGATADLGNGSNGIYIGDSANNVIGDTNLISGNTGRGVYITGSAASGNEVWGNFIGLGFVGGQQAAIRNDREGVLITLGAHDNVIGGFTAGRGNVISGNLWDGMLITSAGANNSVVGNVIGAGQGPGGTVVAIPNGGHGVQVINTPNSRIGVDASLGSGNTISGNGGNGVYVFQSNGTLIAGNAIGSGQGGTVPLPNSGNGIGLSGSHNCTIGGDTSGEDNEVSGNLQHGIYISGSSGTQILNNAIGVDGNGTVAVPNGGNGIYLNSATNTLITTVNISGNALNGLQVFGGTGTTFRGNFVGTNLASTQAIPNGVHGVVLQDTSGNTIGEPVSGGGNVISGNGGSGIWLTGANNNVITNNIIGSNLATDMLLPNGAFGILLQSSNDNLVGGAAQNLVVGNTSAGIAIVGGLRNRVRPNMIDLNGGLGIDLDRDGSLPVDGVTFNDSDDPDTGANDLLNTPILTAATSTTVSGRLETLPNTQLTVDLYRSAGCDPAGFGEGAAFLGSTTVTTNGSGVATWSMGFPAGSPGDAFTATATAIDSDSALNTSEHSQCIVAGRRPVETLTVFNPSASTGTVSLISTLYDPLTSAPGAFTSYVPGAPGGPGKWVMGDWDGDGIDTPAVYQDTGVFRYTNDVGATGNWTALWFGLLGKPPVAGRFNPALPNDCIGVIDNAPMGADDAFNMYYTCDLTSGPNPAKLGQWLSLVLPTSQGFTGPHQFEAGDFDNNGVDSIAVRRGTVISWTNVAPSSGHALFNLAQFIGVPPGASGTGNFVVGDWNGDGLSSFGLYYQDGTFQRRNDLDWNSGAYTLQRVGQPLGTPTTPASWRPGGSQP